MSNDGAEAIARSLRFSQLESLNLSSKFITDLGVAGFAASCQLPALKRLTLTNNHSVLVPARGIKRLV